MNDRIGDNPPKHRIISSKITEEEYRELEAAAHLLHERGELSRGTPSSFARKAVNQLTDRTLRKKTDEDAKPDEKSKLNEQLNKYKAEKEEAEREAEKWRAKYRRENGINDNLLRNGIDLLDENLSLRQQVQQLAVEKQQLANKLKSYENPFQSVMDVMTFKAMTEFAFK